MKTNHYLSLFWGLSLAAIASPLFAQTAPVSTITNESLEIESSKINPQNLLSESVEKFDQKNSDIGLVNDENKMVINEEKIPSIKPINSYSEDSLSPLTQSTENVEQSDTPPEENIAIEDQWHIKFQPYATIPFNTYGTATVRGINVDYHLGLGSLLQVMSATASGRVEAWNGNWGFIVDGYFVNLQGILSFQRDEFPRVNSLSAINYILSSDLNARLQGVTDSIEQQLTPLGKIEAIKDSEQLANIKVNVQDLKSQVAEDAQRILAAKTKLEELQTLVDNNRGALQNLVFKFDTFKDNVADSLTDLRDLSLKVGNIKEDTAALWQDLQSANINPDLDPRQIKVFLAKNVDTLKTIKDSEILGNAREQVQDISNKAQDIQNKVESARALGQEIEQKVNEIRSVRDIEQLKTKLTQTKDLIQQTQQKIEVLRTLKDSEELANLQNKLQNLQTLLNKEIGVIDQIKDYANNPNSRDAIVSTNSDLSFSQGIYDFAISYHFGDPASYVLPKEPSNRNFPLIWFEPIIGTRLNDININLNQIINVQYTSSLVNFQGSYQYNLNQGRTWFEPMIGGKFGIQISDPITFWLRGDVSGFDLVADSNWSWNALAGMDWWVNPNTSLQLGYRFYQIKFHNGIGQNAFGFSESFNGPFVSATFNF